MGGVKDVSGGGRKATKDMAAGGKAKGKGREQKDEGMKVVRIYLCGAGGVYSFTSYNELPRVHV